MEFSNFSSLETVWKSSVFGDRKRRFSVDGWPIGRKKDAFSNLSGLVWTGPKAPYITNL